MSAPVQLYPALEAYLDERALEVDAISADRRSRLERLADFIAARRAAELPCALTFVCTHNSRRSHLAQLWATAAARRVGLAGVETYSGGIERTAFEPRAVETLRWAGFRIEAATSGPNPEYRVWFSDDAPPATCFSKLLDEPPNPRADFAAVLVCADVDARCPTVPGAAAVIALPYDDPKSADGTPQESAIYDERCRQIAREMLWTMSSVIERLGR